MLAMTGPVTLGDLMRDHRLRWVYCRECGRERDLDPATLPLPGEYPVPEVGKRMRCSACGSRKVHTAPELYPGGVEAMRKNLKSATGERRAAKAEVDLGAAGTLSRHRIHRDHARVPLRHASERLGRQTARNSGFTHEV